ncbi:MAG: hypothetical protein WKG01_39665 [Kofleriaceae bacterium]
MAARAMQAPRFMPTHLDHDLPYDRRDPAETVDTWNKNTWIFPTLVGVVVFAFAIVYLFFIR